MVHVTGDLRREGFQGRGLLKGRPAPKLNKIDVTTEAGEDERERQGATQGKSNERKIK